MKRVMHLFIFILLKMFLEKSKDPPMKQICKKGLSVRGESERVETRGKRE